ncbi:CTP synthase C-terminal region-related (seleno)protein [Brenneria uluponensis]|uniref:CTP synthase C-terminal region-related (seleno)protein n=1 Tax=Brenneria uluponensis TaxID=3057057 RepID=UPI0028EC5815|nr:CTP synthase [Brenneria ulupoensis]
MKHTIKIALIGDYNVAVAAHRAIPSALELAARHLNLTVKYQWLSSETLSSTTLLKRFDAVWCIPASPYRNDDNILAAIRFARESQMPFLGTCGGCQYALLEYARNVLQWQDANNAEVTQEGRLVITPLQCELVEKQGDIHLDPESLIGRAYGVIDITEGYRCRYGINEDFRAEFQMATLNVSGIDNEGDIRAIELSDHPFFVGTLFQPERAALKGIAPPVAIALVEAALVH